MERVTLQTIADELGVSRATVSNAYNRPERLSAALRERVLHVARDLGYRGPDPVARRLRLGRGGAVGVLFTEPLDYAFADPVAVDFLAGLAGAVSGLSSNLVLVSAAPGVEVGAAIRHAMVDAMCVYSMPEQHHGVDAVLGLDIPIVLVDQPRLPGRAFVGIDDREGGRLVGEHLVRFGHRRIAVLTSRLRSDDHEGPVDRARQGQITFRLFRDRLAGLRDALTDAGVDWSSVPVQERRNSIADGAAGAHQLLDHHPTAIVALTDQLAIGALEACAARGRSVPGDVSVTGFDGTTAAATAGLTTVEQPVRAKGQAAGRLLAQIIDGAPARADILAVRLRVRGSTATTEA